MNIVTSLTELFSGNHNEYLHNRLSSYYQNCLRDCNILIQNLGYGDIDCVFLFGVEIEFYVKSDKIIKLCDINKLHTHLIEFSNQNGIKFLNIEEEDGDNQFEIQFQPYNFPEELAQDVIQIKSEVINFIQKEYSLQVSFESKPYSNQPGNAIHFHISLYNKNNLYNLFQYKNNEYSDVMLYSINGLMLNTKKFFKIYAPTNQCYERFSRSAYNDKDIYRPYTISWGYDNRTCSIRLPPPLMENNYDSRIEHRISSVCSNPYLVLITLLQSILCGLKLQEYPQDAVFGNSFSDVYNHLERLPKNLFITEREFDLELISQLLSSDEIKILINNI
jgi:glutamine synthetase